MKKVLIENKPSFGETSQYNFSDDASPPFNYTDSTSLPENNDKFQNKDLQTTSYGSIINEYIIENNLKYSGSSAVQIQELRIDNAGVNYDLENCQVRGWFFSRQYFRDRANNKNPEDVNYDTLNSVLNDTDANPSRFYRDHFSDRSDGSDLGDIPVISEPIVSNFEDDNNIQIGSFTNDNGEYKLPTDDEFSPSPLRLSEITIPENSSTALIDSENENPLYFCFWMKGDADRWSGTDRREKRFQVFKIDNLQLFNEDGSGTVKEIDFPNGDADSKQDGGGGGSSWSAQSPAFIVKRFKVRIDTVSGFTNEGVDDSTALELVPDVLPSREFFLNTLDSVDFFKNFAPSQQCFNTDLAASEETLQKFPNFFPLTKINILQDADNIDLQSYYEFQSNLSIKASAPATIKINIQPVLNELGESSTELSLPYLYFVVRWDDVNDEIKTLDDYLDDVPLDNVELLRKQTNDNTYIPNIFDLDLSLSGDYHNFTSLYLNNVKEIQNIYNTPGLKTIKIIMVTFDKDTNQLGRWKLIKSRFYLDIPINQYPDFGEIGGSDYTTIPWPYTTAVIGGVDNNSKYKQSVQNTLSSGKIGNTDVIDERFLINDLENSELGKSIKSMDLEQCRYFNKSYNIFTLLGIDAVQNNELISFDDYDGDINKFPMESSVGQIFISDNQDIDLRQSCKLELNTGEISGKTIYDSSGNSNKGFLIGDYRIKKNRKGEPMKRDSFVKVPKKSSNRRGAL